LKSVALCFSGGEIRSAAFCLGVMQAFAEPSTNQTEGEEAPTALLAQFQYLSTVSGGGYIGSWLSAWRRNSSSNDIIKALAARGQPDFSQLTWLRAFSNHPKIGLFSLDTWTAATLWVRNLLRKGGQSEFSSPVHSKSVVFRIAVRELSRARTGDC
jgi:hypothetical protein